MIRGFQCVWCSFHILLMETAVIVTGCENFQYGSTIVFSLSLEIQPDMLEWISSPVDIARKDVDTTNG